MSRIDWRRYLLYLDIVVPELPHKIDDKASAWSQESRISWWLAVAALLIQQWILNLPSELMPMKLRWHLEKNGPVYLDKLCAVPFLSTLRLFCRDASNAVIARRNRPSLLHLPNELITEIIRFVAIAGCPSHTRKAYRYHGCQSSRKAVLRLSRTNKRMRALAAALVLDRVTLTGDWSRIARAVLNAENSTHVGTSTRSLTIRPYVEKICMSYRECKDIPPPPQILLSRLVSLKLELRKLDTLVLDIPLCLAQVFQKTFEDKSFMLQNVKSVFVGSGIEWIIPRCPNVERICTTGYPWRHDVYDDGPGKRNLCELIRAAGQATKLHHFEVDQPWTPDHFVALKEAMPDIQSLAVPRHLQHLHQFLPCLACFRNLLTLALDHVSRLDVGFHEPRSCLYQGAAFLKDVDEQRRQAERHVADEVFARLPRLKELWIGNVVNARVVGEYTGKRSEILWSHETYRR